MTAASGQELAETAVNWAALRRRFGVFDRRVYINSCSYGALADSVRAAMDEYLDDRLENGANWDAWCQRQEALRESTGRLLNCTADELAITTSASAGISSLASALDFSGPRNQVVISDLEFPTNAQIWYAQQSRGAQVIRVPETPSGLDMHALKEAIGARTRIVALTHVCYRNGSRLDIPAIANMAHEHGALLMVDGYQSVGSLHCDVRELGADFLAGGYAKYLIGTAGVGYFFARAGLIESLVPTVTGWFADADIFAMSVERYRPSPTARRFEQGTPPVPSLYAALAGIELILEVGTRAIEARNRELSDAIHQRARAAGYQIVTPEDPACRGQMVALASTDDHELVRRLAQEEGIVTSCRDGNLRVSPHFYNNLADIDALFLALDRLPELMKRTES